jgi:predicted RecA/RadA family phage recombinase
MKNFSQQGDVLDLTAPAGGVVSGTGYLIGAAFVVAVADAAAGLPFPARIAGVFTLPKVSAQAWTEGALVYWDNTAKNVTTTVGSNTKIGVAAAAAVNPSATGLVRLNGAF